MLLVNANYIKPLLIDAPVKLMSRKENNIV